jgi:DNA repair protein RecN (Recombination protein N)
MLRNLSVQDFVIVDRIELDFAPGFTVLTGETGAGKSILIDALGLLLGERSDAGAVRDGCEKAELAAEFDVNQLPTVLAWLEANALQGDAGICLMRRSIDAGGRSRSYINGHPATLQQLREVGERLVDIHGQHQHQSLLRGDVQRELLDDFAGQRPLSRKVAAAYREWQAVRQKRKAWEQGAASLAGEREELEWKLNELKALAFSLEEWQKLIADHGRLAHSAALAEGTQAALDVLSEGEGDCLSQVSAVIARLNTLSGYDPALTDTIEILDSALVQVQESVYSLRHYRERVEMEPERLQQIESRMSAVHGVARKHRVRPEDLSQLQVELAVRLEEILSMTDPGELSRQEEVAREAYAADAAQLSEARRKAAQALGQQVTAAMQTLAMQGGVFLVAFIELAEGNTHGLEQVEFQVSAQAGLPVRPLSRVVSGGELSRISLAVQTVTSRVAQVPTLIFDEVDSGIGGKVAEIVGRMMRKLGGERQVMCVTHLPQVAAAADNQWKVEKYLAENRVLSKVLTLEKFARVEEIARMLGGIKITDTTRKHAAELLGL